MDTAGGSRGILEDRYRAVCEENVILRGKIAELEMRLEKLLNPIQGVDK